MDAGAVFRNEVLDPDQLEIFEEAAGSISRSGFGDEFDVGPAQVFAADLRYLSACGPELEGEVQAVAEEVALDRLLGVEGSIELPRAAGRVLHVCLEVRDRQGAELTAAEVDDLGCSLRRCGRRNVALEVLDDVGGAARLGPLRRGVADDVDGALAEAGQFLVAPRILQERRNLEDVVG